MDDIEAQQNTILLQDDCDGKASIINDYCADAVRHGKEECFWICVPHHRRIIAKDIAMPSDKPTFQLHDLANECGWWKRWSLYSAIRFKEVEIKFAHITMDQQIDVITMPIDRECVVANIDLRIKQHREEVEDHESCGIKVDGTTHPDNQRCPNETWDEISETFCPVKEIIRLEVQKQQIRCVDDMLNFYWETRSATNCLDYLRSTGFVSSYRYLQKDKFHDALQPLGKSIKALCVIEGWHTRYLAFLTAQCVASSICVIAVTTAVTHNIDSGLAAGSYAIGLASLGLALLSVFSAIL